MALSLGAFGASVAYLCAAWLLVFELRVGPVNVTLDAASGYGVHAGDMLALPLVLFACVSFVFGVVALDTGLRRRSRTPWRLPVAPAPVPVAAAGAALRIPAAAPPVPVRVWFPAPVPAAAAAVLPARAA